MIEFFNFIGEKVEQVVQVNGEVEDDFKFIDEIEFFCMNCYENVSCKFLMVVY